MSLRWMTTSRTQTKSALKLCVEKSIPIHKPRDLIAVFADPIAATASREDYMSLISRVESRILGFGQMDAFQLLNCLDRYAHTAVPPRSLVGDLRDCLLSGSSSNRNVLSPIEFVRPLEIIANFNGPTWDPVSASTSPPVISVVANSSIDSLIRLCRLGMVSTPGLVDRVDNLRKKATPLQAAKLAMYLSDPSLLPNPSESVPIGTLPYVLQFFAAGGGESLPAAWYDYTTAAAPAMDPVQAQLSVWSLLALGYIPTDPLVSTLYHAANLADWHCIPMKQQCMMGMDPFYRPPYPVRIPQFASTRKSDRVDSILRTLRDRGAMAEKDPVVDDKYFADLRVNDKYVLVNTVSTDVRFKIFKRLIPVEVVEVDTKNLSDIQSLVSP